LRTFLNEQDYPDANKCFEILINEFAFDLYVIGSHLEHMKKKGLVREKEVVQYVVTKAGIEELKRMENEVPETPEQKRFRVLKTLYDMAPHDKHGMVIVDELAKELGMAYQEANRILIYWEEKGLVHSPTDESVALTARAIDELEEKIRNPGKPTEHFPATINIIDYSVKIIGDVSGNIQGGQSNTQKVISNEPISSILPQLTALIKTVKAEEFPDKDDVVRDLEQAHQVAITNPDATSSDGVWARITTKLTAAKTTMELAGFVIKTYPYWPQVLDFFQRHS
jgi:hypothetical protein